MKTIKIPLSESNDFPNLYKYIKEESLFDSEIILDASGLTKLRTASVLLIVMFVVFHKHRKCKISILLPKNETTKQYIKDIKLAEFCRENYSQPSVIKPINVVNAFPIWRVSKEQMVSYISQTSDYFKGIDKNKNFETFEIILAELVNNVYDHSENPQIGAYVFTQYLEQSDELETTVADLGIGIPHSVNNFLEKTGKTKLSSLESISKAFEFLFTTGSFPHNRGRGLDIVNTAIKTINGTLHVYSDNAHLELSNGKIKLNSNPINDFKGTMVNLKIKISYLDDIEIMNSFDELW